MKKSLLAVVALTFAASSQASPYNDFATFSQMIGQQTSRGNFYMTGTVGLTDYKDDSVTDSAAIAGIRAGYEFGRWFGLELGFITMGKVDFPSDSNISTSTKYIGIKPNVPLGILDLYLRAGIHSYDAEVEHQNGNVSRSGTRGMYGVGLDLRLRNLSVGVGYSIYNLEAIDVGNYEINTTIRF